MKNQYEIRGDTAYIYDSNGELFLVDADDVEKIAPFRWHCRKGEKSYVIGNAPHKKKIYLHRYLLQVGDFQLKVDHKNHNPRDNRKSNLRICSNWENSVNRSDRDKAGVSYRKDKKKWRAYINLKYRQINLGYYSTEKEARAVRKKAVAALYGEVV
ncbi:HNH endonuclease [Selenomonas ruminantium]|uniref:AP2 domain-containing protein n=1 Tax=Selenomonas ruminantium TaxID=971 RepID=A0A1H0P8D9_SELRU|nr:HNH endonuclease [Selenomonas ruminantium]SDP00958.1 AP2 domain-containing protein [Selenomonas ruminantium]